MSLIDLGRQDEGVVVDVTIDEPTTAITAHSPFQLFVRRLRHDRVAIAALAFIIMLTILAICAPLVSSILGLGDANAQNVPALDPFGQPTGPSAEHPFGVADLGRDILARVLYGSRVSRELACFATCPSAVICGFCGIVAG